MKICNKSKMNCFAVRMEWVKNPIRCGLAKSLPIKFVFLFFLSIDAKFWGVLQKTISNSS